MTYEIRRTHDPSTPVMESELVSRHRSIATAARDLANLQAERKAVVALDDEDQLRELTKSETRTIGRAYLESGAEVSEWVDGLRVISRD